MLFSILFLFQSFFFKKKKKVGGGGKTFSDCTESHRQEESALAEFEECQKLLSLITDDR